MDIFFITRNKGKFEEVKELIPPIKQLNIDLPEIQELNPQTIIEAKLQESYKHHSGEFIVEDTSLYINELNGLPGPLIKWFLHSLGNNGIYELTSQLKSNKAVAKTRIGYSRSPDDIYFFEGAMEGTIVAPSGENGFGWDAIFQPSGQEKTFAEMTKNEKAMFSMRRIAVERLNEFLNK